MLCSQYLQSNLKGVEVHYTARCCPAPLRKKKKSSSPASAHQFPTERGEAHMKTSGPPHAFLPGWCVALETSAVPLKRNKWMNRKRWSIIRHGNGKEEDRREWRQAGRQAGWLLLLKNNRVVIQCINLGIQWVFSSFFLSFLSLYATATLHRRSAHSQSPWVLLLSALPIWRQTTAGKEAEKLCQSATCIKIRRRGKNIEGLQNIETALSAFQTTGQYSGQMSLAHARTSHRLHMSHSDAPVWPHAAGHHRLDRQGWGALNTTYKIYRYTALYT